MKVKFFREEYMSDLEDIVNDFIKDKDNIIDIKFAIDCETMATCYCAMIIIK